MASQLADEGAAIVAADIDQAGLSRLSSDAGGGPDLVVTDVASAAEVRRLASAWPGGTGGLTYWLTAPG